MTETQDTVSIAEAREAVDNMSRRLGLLHMCYARALVDALGETRGKELIEKAIWDYGTKIGQQTRARVVAQGIEPTVGNFDKGSDLPPIGFKAEAVVVDGEPRIRSTRCAIADVWREHGEEALGQLYCLVDPAKMQAYDPNWTMIHTRRIPLGDECCEFAIRPTEPEDA